MNFFEIEFTEVNGAHTFKIRTQSEEEFTPETFRTFAQAYKDEHMEMFLPDMKYTAKYRDASLDVVADKLVRDDDD